MTMTFAEETVCRYAYQYKNVSLSMVAHKEGLTFIPEKIRLKSGVVGDVDVCEVVGLLALEEPELLGVTTNLTAKELASKLRKYFSNVNCFTSVTKQTVSVDLPVTCSSLKLEVPCPIHNLKLKGVLRTCHTYISGGNLYLDYGSTEDSTQGKLRGVSKGKESGLIHVANLKTNNGIVGARLKCEDLKAFLDVTLEDLNTVFSFERVPQVKNFPVLKMYYNSNTGCFEDKSENSGLLVYSGVVRVFET